MAFIGFPLEAVFGIAVLALRGMAKSHKYYPALFYFFVGLGAAILINFILAFQIAFVSAIPNTASRGNPIKAKRKRLLSVAVV